MEELFDQLKATEFVNKDSKEIQDIQRSVKTFLFRYRKSLNDSHDFIKITKFKRCGSTKEGTRIWGYIDDIRYLEIDYLAILKRPPMYSKHTHVVCDGFMNVVQDDKENGSLILSTKDVAGHFQEAFMKSIENRCRCYILKWSPEGYLLHSRGRICTRCSVETKPGSLAIASYDEIGSPHEFKCNIILKWTRKLSIDLTAFQGQPEQQSVYVLVDLLPAFGLHKSKRAIKTSGLRNLVPKYCGNHNSCWKISHCSKEIKVLRAASQKHRDVYMALKSIIGYVFPKSASIYDYIPSYVMKTALIRHLGICTSKKADIRPCVNEILLYLSTAYKLQFLPNLYTSINLLSNKTHLDQSYFDLCSQAFVVMNCILQNFELFPTEYLKNTNLFDLILCTQDICISTFGFEFLEPFLGIPFSQEDEIVEYLDYIRERNDRKRLLNEKRSLHLSEHEDYNDGVSTVRTKSLRSRSASFVYRFGSGKQ